MKNNQTELNTNAEVNEVADNNVSDKPSVSVNATNSKKKNLPKERQPKIHRGKEEKAQRMKERKALAEQKKAERNKAKHEPKELTLAEQLYTLAKEQLKGTSTWYKLDNNATIFPIVAEGQGKSTFRLAVTLYDKVDPIALQKAVNKIVGRFPTITGSLRTGFFWHYLEKPIYPIVVCQQNELSALPFTLDGKRSQIRVFYNNYDIAVEFFHSATDGTGGLVFLNSLLVCYFRELGIEINDLTNAFDCRDIPTFEEISDAVPKIAQPKQKVPDEQKIKARIYNFKKLPDSMFISRFGYVNATELKTLANSHNATVTELLTSMLLIAMGKHFTQSTAPDKRPITLMVPANLRKMFGINTLRNFMYFMVITYHGQTDLDEVIADVQEQIKRQYTKEYFVASVSPNYYIAHSFFSKISPLILKRPLIRMVTNKRGGGTFNSSTLSNLGIVKAPKEFAKLVLRYEFLLGQDTNPAVAFSTITYNNICTIAASDKLVDPMTEMYFFRMLADMGLKVTIESDKTEGLR